MKSIRLIDCRDLEATMAQTAKEQARELIDSLEEDVSWEDIKYRIWVRDKLERALQRLDTEPTLSTQEVLERFDLSKSSLSS